MKKLISLFAILLIFVLSAEAQRASTTTVVPNTGLKNLSMLPVDSITQGATAYWVFDVGNRPAYYYAVSIAFTLISTNTDRIATTVWGSMDNTNWVSSGITQVNAFPSLGGGADTTFVLASVTTPQLWRYLKIRFIATDNNVKGVKVSGLGLKVANK
jgi:hypothetical protein